MNKRMLVAIVVLFFAVMTTGGCGGGDNDYFVPEPEEPIENPVIPEPESPIENPVVPEPEETEEPEEPETDVTSEDEYANITYPDGVTEEMTKAEYWTALVSNPDEILVTTEDIGKMNKSILNANTSIVDLELIEELSLAKFEAFNRELYISGEKIDEEAILEYFEAHCTDLPELLYCVTVKRANLKCWPIVGNLGYTENDPDDEAQLSCLEVNSPFVAVEICQYNGHTFFYGQSEFLTGWLDEDELAICHSREEWLDSWKVKLDAKDFLVVTQDKIRLEPMLLEPEISDVELLLGTRLKLVDSADIPYGIGERETSWFNYVVYLPTRDADGYYVKKMAMIPSRYSVSIGFLPYTQANFAEVALSMLGNRYGWGGMLHSLDASLFVRQIYACFGLRLPTNTTFQRNTSYFTELPEMSAEDKQDLLKSLPIGTILYSPGFAMLYMGNVNNVGYFVGDLGVIGEVVIGDGETEETIVARRPYSVVLGSLNMLRRNGTSFFDSLNGFINFADFVQ